MLGQRHLPYFFLVFYSDKVGASGLHAGIRLNFNDQDIFSFSLLIFEDCGVILVKTLQFETDFITFIQSYLSLVFILR